MAAAEHAIPVVSDESMELPSLPPNQGVEAMKDIVFGSVSGSGKLDCNGIINIGANTPVSRLQEWQGS